MKHKTDQKLNQAIIAGLTFAKDHGLDKPHDVATCIRVALNEAGLKVIKGKRPVDFRW